MKGREALGSSLAGLGGHSHAQQEKGVWGDTQSQGAGPPALAPCCAVLNSLQGSPGSQRHRGTMAEPGCRWPDSKPTGLTSHLPFIGPGAPHPGGCSHPHPTGKEAQTQKGKRSCPPTSPGENVAPLDMDPRLSESKSTLAPCPWRRPAEPCRSLDRMGRGSGPVA